ncbi:DUF1553 domain-containing protein [Tautonia rosea]|uniref:DUF1553 domain-containing protein n=1 Tax=Tautonia rosea TaxID=2728037 RepID=UPI0014760F6B|nr:DUF1553 domain-containing protein [Tautonia rosea]
MPAIRFWSISGILLASLVWGVSPSAGDLVQVEVWENLPESWDWQAPADSPADRFEVPALGIPHVPAKYSDRGIELDRSGPFALRAETTLQVPPGAYRLILRSRYASQLRLDRELVAECQFLAIRNDGHDVVRGFPPHNDPPRRPLRPGDNEQILDWTSDGLPHQVELWAIVGGKNLRPETSELSVSIAAPGEPPVLIGGSDRIELTDPGWRAYEESEDLRIEALNTTRRRQAARSEDRFWQKRHELARLHAEKSPSPEWPGDPSENLIDRYVRHTGVKLPPLTDDLAFFRRLSLDSTGVIPTPDEVKAFLADNRPDKRARAIEARLADPRWADSWMGYWQDVLAENPGILKPTLNNTGPFRRYLHQALLDNTPIDRLVTDLVRMEGSVYGGAPGGFRLATENDAPMAAKAHVLARAFLAADLQCARCHDAPTHPFYQEDLFGLAALLEGKPVTIPATSTVRQQPGGRVPSVSISLAAGDAVEPHWNLTTIASDELADTYLPEGADLRDRLAAWITTPENGRFAPVLANRVWQRYLGSGLVNPVDDWDLNTTRRHPELLDALSREFMSNGYDLKHLARLIFESSVYQAQVPPHADSSVQADPLLPARRRLSAEQVVDSLFQIAGKPFHTEELNHDIIGRRPPRDFLNFGRPRRAWQFVSNSTDRDRPALILPVAESILDVLVTFGWRPTRQDPISVRDEESTPLQPAILANGVVVSSRIARLSDDSALTDLCLDEETAPELIHAVSLRILSRPPIPAERDRLVAYLGESFNDRIVPGAEPASPTLPLPRLVSWANHLNAEATEIQLANQRLARVGDPPTPRLTLEFRERMEDVIWVMINSPEFVFLP